MKRFDYRRKYTNWTQEQMQKHLPILRYRMLKHIGLNDMVADDCLRRISYLESKINKDA